VEGEGGGADFTVSGRLCDGFLDAGPRLLGAVVISGGVDAEVFRNRFENLGCAGVDGLD
jgi:hypothetical protein